MGSGPAPAYAAEARRAVRAPPGKGRSARRRAKPLSTMRSPSRAGSLLVYRPARRRPARTKARYAAKQSQGKAERRRERSSHSPLGEGLEPTRAWARGPAPAPFCAFEGVRPLPGKGRAKRGRAQPLPAGRSPGRAWSPRRWGLAQRRPALQKAHQAAKASPDKGWATLGRTQSLSSGRSPGRAWSPLVWGPAKRRPARTKARQAARASPDKS